MAEGTPYPSWYDCFKLYMVLKAQGLLKTIADIDQYLDELLGGATEPGIAPIAIPPVLIPAL